MRIPAPAKHLSRVDRHLCTQEALASRILCAVWEICKGQGRHSIKLSTNGRMRFKPKLSASKFKSLIFSLHYVLVSVSSRIFDPSKSIPVPVSRQKQATTSFQFRPSDPSRHQTSRLAEAGGLKVQGLPEVHRRVQAQPGQLHESLPQNEKNRKGAGTVGQW